MVLQWPQHLKGPYVTKASWVAYCFTGSTVACHTPQYLEPSWVIVMAGFVVMEVKITAVRSEVSPARVLLFFSDVQCQKSPLLSRHPSLINVNSVSVGVPRALQAGFRNKRAPLSTSLRERTDGS